MLCNVNITNKNFVIAHYTTVINYLVVRFIITTNATQFLPRPLSYLSKYPEIMSSIKRDLGSFFPLELSIFLIILFSRLIVIGSRMSHTSQVYYLSSTHWVLVYSKEQHNYQIMKFLKENGPSEFGLISKHLDKNKMGYKKTKGLAKKLNTLVRQRKIKKKEQKPYPVYSIIKDQDLDFAIAGDQFREQTMNMSFGFGNMDENYWKDDAKLYSKDNHETKFVKIMVTRYGFYVFASLLKNLDYWIKKTDGSKEQINFRKIWLDHALDFPKMQETIFNSFLDQLTEGHVKEPGIPKNKKIAKKKINKIKKSINELYPKLSQLIDIYEHHYEEESGMTNRLKNYPGYKKQIGSFKL